MSKNLLRRFILLLLFLFPISRVLPVSYWNPDLAPLTSANSVVDEDLEIFGDGVMTDTDISVSEDIYIIAQNSDVTVSVTSNNISLNTVDGAYTWAHMIFYADTGRTITVNCDFDLKFETFHSGYPHDFILTFSGQGQTIFNLGDYNAANGTRGSQISFTGFQDYGYAFPSESAAAIDHQNCRVYILMDQTETQAVTNGLNKVLFRRKDGGTHTKFPIGVHIGDGAFVTFLSTNPTGISTDLSASGDFASLAFDPTHEGAGTMYLDIDSKDDESIRGPFSDGGIAVYGHYVSSWSESDIRTNATMNSVAGIKAIFRIIDDTRFAAVTDPGASDARGLMIINRNTTIPKFACDPYGEDVIWDDANSDANHPNNPHYWSYDYSWRQAPKTIATTGCSYYYTGLNNPGSYLGMNVQSGFILGKNGRIEVAHETFLDYVATLTNLSMDQTLADDYSTIRTGAIATERLSSPIFKNKNPAAFFVDGLFDSWRVNTQNGSTFDPTANDEQDPDAEIFLYGNSKILLRAGSHVVGNPSAEYAENGDYVFTFTIDTATYDGQSVVSTNLTGDEGRHVLDLEAPLIVRSFSRDEMPGSNYIDPDPSDVGQMNLPTVSIDYTGREIDYTILFGDPYISRPLIQDSSYKIYDSPSVFLSASLQIYDTTFNHNDITKLLTPSPELALPNFVGGEAKVFNTLTYPASISNPSYEELYQTPRVEFYNSNLDIHEHFVGAGVRFVAHEQIADKDGVALTGSDANNTSVFKFFDHWDTLGRDLDTPDHGYGRLFMASCSNNKMSSGTTYADLQDCFINVYRQTDNAGDPADTIKLSLQTSQDQIPILNYLIDSDQRYRAHHLVLLNRSSYGVGLVDLGWTTTVGDDSKYPWQDLSGDGSNYFDIKATTSGTQVMTDTPPATMSIDGNYFYFGGTDILGVKSQVPVTASGQGSVVYVNHGGRITITQPSLTDHGYDVFVDLPIVYKLWNFEGLRGIVDLPKDQVTYGYGYGRQAYSINTVLSNMVDSIGVHLNTFNSSNVQGYSRISSDRYSGEEYLLPWRYRVDNNVPVKEASFKSLLTRYTAIIDEMVTMPSNIVYFGAGSNWADIVTQLKVSGSTMADPMHLLVDGYADGPGYAWIKEIVSVESNPAVYGEGDHGIIFLRNGGRIGLGNNSWNSDSLNSWKLLGKDFLTISPSGQTDTHVDDVHGVGVIDLNSDVYVIDRGAFVAESKFGYAGPDRLTINLNGNDLIIPADGELDLSSFGQNTYRQEIEFAGEGRVVLGHGAVIRFPNTTVPTDISNYPVLYFNDNTRLVIEDDPEFGKGSYETLAAADVDKVKIFGLGQIWLNKDASFEVMGGAKVRVGSDDDTPNTDIRLSIQRQGDFVIGDEQERGGSFEVGNPAPVEVVDSGTTLAPVSFELVLNGPKAVTHLDRGAFMGFGVGVIDKSSDTMNGTTSTLANNPLVDPNAGDVTFSPDETNAWKVQTLYDVHNISITIYEGIFDHSNIFNGSDRKASILAFGPLRSFDATAGKYTLQLSDPDRSKILGGGNFMLLKENLDIESEPIPTYINAWDFADPDFRETWDPADPQDYGMYNMLASDMIVQQWNTSNFASSTLLKLTGGGISFESGVDRELDLFTFLSTPKFADLNGKMVNCGASQYRTYIGFVNTAQTNNYYSSVGADQIYRLTGLSVIGNGRPEDGTAIGVLGATGSSEPIVYTIVNRR
ncbi:MAG: hypothetical protein ABIF12_00645 [bacterium]